MAENYFNFQPRAAPSRQAAHGAAAELLPAKSSQRSSLDSLAELEALLEDQHQQVPYLLTYRLSHLLTALLEDQHQQVTHL